jgi:hypothetical protein
MLFREVTPVPFVRDMEKGIHFTQKFKGLATPGL